MLSLPRFDVDARATVERAVTAAGEVEVEWHLLISIVLTALRSVAVLRTMITNCVIEAMIGWDQVLKNLGNGYFSSIC